MILAIDVGNTNIVLGGVENGKEVFSARLASDKNKTEDQYALDFKGTCARQKGPPARPRDSEPTAFRSIYACRARQPL